MPASMAKKNPAAVALGKRGAKARMKKMTPEQRSEVAKQAIKARWDRVKEEKAAVQP